MIAGSDIISFSCPGCGRDFSVPTSFAGRRATCKTCRAKVEVPALETPTSAPDETPAQTPSEAPFESPIVTPAASRLPSADVDRSLPANPSEVEHGHGNGNGDGGHHGNGKALPLVRPLDPLAILSADSTDAEVLPPLSSSNMPARRTHYIGVISEAQSAPNAAPFEPPAPALVDAPVPAPSSVEDPALAEISERPFLSGEARPRVPVRTRRLLVDAEQMVKAFSGEGFIRVVSMTGDPPETYQIEYNVTSLQRGWLGRIKKRKTHLVEIQLTGEFPRLSPKCRMLTPVFHPNIDQTTICVGDHWTAGERLVDLVVRIGEMLAYQAYNIRSPLNAQAAMWADLNTSKLPIDPRNFHPVEST